MKIPPDRDDLTTVGSRMVEPVKKRHRRKSSGREAQDRQRAARHRALLAAEKRQELWAAMPYLSDAALEEHRAALRDLEDDLAGYDAATADGNRLIVRIVEGVPIAEELPAGDVRSHLGKRAA